MPDKQNPFGTIFLGRDEATYGKDGIGDIAYDPDFECGGPVGTPGRACPYRLQEKDAMGLTVTGGREGRVLQVGIASFRDPLCPDTLYNIFTKAKRPQDVRVRVMQQNDPDLDTDCLEGYCARMAKEKPGQDCAFADQVFIHQIHAREAAGPTWARGILSEDIAQAHKAGEVSAQDHCMSIDSHMDFEPEWDEKLVDMWDLAANEYAVLSTYVAATDQLGVNLGNAHEVPHLCMIEYTSNVRVWGTKCARNLSKPKLTNAVWGAGLSFSKCHAELKVPVDPHSPYIFDGEEFNRAARFFTYGYDIYTPNRVYVLHDYVRSQHNPVTASYHRLSNQTAEAASHKRLLTMIDVPGGEQDKKKVMRLKKSKYGLGDRRTIDQLIEFTGFDLRHKGRSLDGKNRCGNIQWVPFDEYPKGVNYLPRFDAETEDPLDDKPYDRSSVWYDPKVDGLGIDIEREQDMLTEEERKMLVEHEAVAAAVTGDDTVRGEDGQVKIPAEDLHKKHLELNKEVNALAAEHAKAAAPIISNAEAAAAQMEIMGGELPDIVLNHKPTGPANHRFGGLVVHPIGPGAQQGMQSLPLLIKMSVILLISGVVYAVW
eukprot:CAMPEP_0198289800 /NCGR_PEP_ID=MMETSP1449-20131203/7874_1 /TAXON_ID=420275 /ORGANISM="Attheya septentrionalis, Strain CCMP2084" /LENGTH=596 /DNA_ID=CAMNT_0043988189 /DNA_START=109 /DNA_END=1896 /DNA_ORIENTATION=+